MSTPVTPPVRYQVVAPMVVAASSTPQGTKLQNFYRHALLPPDVPQKQLDLFLRRRLIVRIDAAGVPVQAETPAVPAAQPRPARAAKTAGG